MRESGPSEEQVEGARLGEIEERGITSGKLGRGFLAAHWFQLQLDLREAASVGNWTYQGLRSLLLSVSRASLL